MPAKQGGVITTAEARLIMKDKSAMNTALLCLQIEAGDRRDDPYTNHAIAVLSISATSSSHHRARILDESARVESAPWHPLRARQCMTSPRRR
jgi:hypothetical protein